MQCLGSVYGTADGGSSRESLNTVQGADQPPYSPAPMVNGNGVYSSNSDERRGSRPDTARSKASLKSTPDHPGNDLPAQMVTEPSPLDIEVTTVRAAKEGIQLPSAQTIANTLLKTPPRQGVILPETTTFSASPAHSPMKAPGEHYDDLPAVMRRHSESADAQPSNSDIISRDFGPQPSDNTRNDTSQSIPAALPHSYPDTQLLHPSSAASIPSTSSPNANNSNRSTKPIRRNTTGSTSVIKSKSAPAATPDPAGPNLVGIAGTVVAAMKDEWDLELDEDMKKQAEQIRRERKRRDLEAQEEERLDRERGVKRDSKGKEKGHARSGSAGARSVGGRSTGAKSLDEWKPVVGNVVGEGHVNYILMYNMLTGIRVAVSIVPLTWIMMLIIHLGVKMPSETSPAIDGRRLHSGTQIQL